MKASEIKELTKEELIENLGDTQESLNKLKINHKIAELENPIEVRAVRRTIARIKTELRSRELQANK
jgi:large subunit ribosomal protein L29